MECAECGGPCAMYDGGEANEYKLRVWVCADCGAWQDEEEDDVEGE